MKIKAFYLSAVAAIVTGLVSCDNAELKYDDVTGPGRLFLNEAVGTAKSVSFVIPDDGSVYTVTPRISKPLGRDLKLTVYVDEKALDEYNKQNNTSYTLLPNTNYEFESSAVIPAGKVVSNPVTITLHPLTTEQNKTGFVHALPIAVKAEGEAMQVLEGADAFVLAATPVPYSNVVEITGNSDSVVYDGTEHSVKDYTVKISDSRYTEKDFTFSGKALASVLARKVGRENASDVVEKLAFGAYNKAFAPNRTGYDWLSVSEENVDAYIADPLCGGMASTGLFLELLDGMAFIKKPANLRHMNMATPVLFISGDRDPVGGMGKGVRAAYDSFRRAGVRDAELKLYPGLRHEILNEDCRAQVYDDLWEWIERHNG